ncbi:MAG: electron transfer flavoprotein subunit alpha/FixB family protein [Saprospiraceae bacterium]
MSVLVYIESGDQIIKKSGFEVAYYGSQAALAMQSESIGVLIGKVSNVQDVTKFGLSKIIHVNPSSDIVFDAQTFAKVIADLALEYDAQQVILSHTSNGKSIAGRLGIRLNAGVVSGVNSLPKIADGVLVTKSVYSGKAIAHVRILTPKSVISVMGNAIKPLAGEGATPVEREVFQFSRRESKGIIERKTTQGVVPLPEAELVVSAGRGMKGPENWGIIEDLAHALGATTACSRPVADADWRPHHEHVGQTGVAIRPNLYFAIGISGAIQHLAGVNNSKVIVVINKDPEAPFFKAADYGVVGDLFEVVPRLTQAVKKLKGHA